MTSKTTITSQSVFIRLPVRGQQNPWIHVEIDPQRFNLRTVSKLYRCVNAERGKGGMQYIALPDSPLPEVERVALSVKSSIKEQYEQLERRLQSIEQSNHLRVIERALFLLTDAMAYRESDRADEAVRQLFGGIESLVGNLASELHSSRENERVLTDIAESLNASVSDSADAEVKKSVYENWGLAALGTIESVREYQEAVSAFEQFEAEMERAYADFALQVTKGDGPIASAMAFFDPPEGGGFITTAIVHRNGTEADDPFVASVEEAKSHVRNCTELLEGMKRKHQLFRLRQMEFCGSESNLNSRRHKAEEACNRLVECQREMSFFRNTHVDFEGPHESNFGCISKEEFDQACSYVPSKNESQHPWFVGTCRKRLREHTQRISTRLKDAPELPVDVVGAIRQVQELITEFEKRLMKESGCEVEMKSKSDPVINQEAPVITISADTEEGSVQIPSPSLESDLLDSEARGTELYELILCVGYVCTYLNGHPNASKTTGGMLMVLIALNRCTKVESQVYREMLNERLMKSSELAESSTQAKRRQMNSDCQWVHFRDKRSWRRFMTRKGARSAAAMLAKHKLTTRIISQANKLIGQNWKSMYLK